MGDRKRFDNKTPIVIVGEEEKRGLMITETPLVGTLRRNEQGQPITNRGQRTYRIEGQFRLWDHGRWLGSHNNATIMIDPQRPRRA